MLFVFTFGVVSLVERVADCAVMLLASSIEVSTVPSIVASFVMVAFVALSVFSVAACASKS